MRTLKKKLSEQLHYIFECKYVLRSRLVFLLEIDQFGGLCSQTVIPTNNLFLIALHFPNLPILRVLLCLSC